MSASESPATRTVRTEDELLSAVRSIVTTLREFDEGDKSARLELPYAESDPMGALGAKVNALILALSKRQQETVTFQRELEEQIATIEQQQQAIDELSTPIIEVWHGVLCAPIVGILDSTRAAELTSSLLNAVVDRKASYIIIDITAIEAMDTRATDYFLRMARAVRLLGAVCVISGMNPSVSQTIAHMGIQMTGVQSFRSLGDALRTRVAATRAQAKPRRAGGPRTR